MPRFYFDVFDGKANKDEAGHDLADASALGPELHRVVADVVMHSNGLTSAIINVRDEDNRTVATASLSLAVSYPDTHH